MKSMAQFWRLEDAERLDGDIMTFTLQLEVDRYTPTTDDVRYQRRLHRLQQQLIQLSRSNEDLNIDESWLQFRAHFIEQLRQTADNFAKDLISAEDAYLMTYVHQGYYEAMLTSAAMTGGGGRSGTQPRQPAIVCNHPECPRRLLPSST
jgi:hypothetical protein